MAPECSATSPLSRIVSEAFFRATLGLEVAKAQRLQYCVSVLGFSLDALDPLNPASADTLVQVATTAERHIRATDILLISPPDAILVMLVDADAPAWRAIVDRLTEALRDLPLPSGQPEQRWSVGGSCYPKTAADPAAVLGQATALMRMASRDGGDRLYSPPP